MPEEKKPLSRRDFMKTAGAAGIGSIAAAVAASGRTAEAQKQKVSEPPSIPTRPFGKTGVMVPILGFGGSHNLTSKQLLLRQAVKMGITYWDTAHSYRNSEKAMGAYFRKFPDDRKKIFLVTKSRFSDPERMTRDFETSLKRLQTSYVDLFFVHQVSDVADSLTRKTREWAEKEKAKGRIRFFGFSTHKNMEACLSAGAELGWIDGIMASYNYRLMHRPEMKKAVDRCVQAGIGLTAMKTQAPFMAYFFATVGRESDAAKKLTEHFVNKGYTPEQAKLKAVWENPHVATICSEMPNLTILTANSAAALNRTSLSSHEKKLLHRYALETASCYCGGCAARCESLLAEAVPVSDVMRCLMYAQGYEQPDRARQLFHRIPAPVRGRIAVVDYSAAEAQCPQNMPISELMKEAARCLT